MAVPAERERVVRLETRAREAETALQQLRSYVELLRRKSGERETVWKTRSVCETEVAGATMVFDFNVPFCSRTRHCCG